MLKKLGFTASLLQSCYAWQVDLRQQEGPYQVYMAPNDNIDVVLGGSAGTGAQWFHHITNPDILTYVD